MNGDDDELPITPPPAPAPRADFVDAVMRQVATRPLPKRPWWRQLFVAREVTVRVRPAAWAVGAAALALLLALVARPRHVAPTLSLPAVEAHAEAPTLVRFALAAPKARSVALAGDFNAWRPEATPLERGADGVWFVRVPLSHGNWSYSFVVDGQWVEDPLAESWRADGFGGKNAVVRVGDVEPIVGSARGG